MTAVLSDATRVADKVIEVRALEADGLHLSAHDTARAALDAGMDSDELRYLAVFTLARAEATGSALDLFRRLRLDPTATKDVGGLYARLMKDLALGGDPAAARVARAAYAGLWERFGDPWFAINAAAMALRAGEREACRAQAMALQDLPDDGSYWSAATRAEAALLAGDVDAALLWLGRAEHRPDATISMRASTRKQVRWEARLLGVDPSIVDALVVPATVHFCGLLPRQAADETALCAAAEAAVAGAGYGYGSLAAGGDIVLAEALLAQGASLTIILPFPADAFVAASVAPAGDAWIPRFHACLAAASEVRVLNTAAFDDFDYALTSRLAMGLARLNGRRLDGPSRQIAVWDGGPARGVAGTASDVTQWRESGGHSQVLDSPWPRRPPSGPPTPPERVARAVLFGDLPRFGLLDDAGLAAFYRGPMARMGAVVDAAAPVYRNAWGDAVQLVFNTIEAAATCALALNTTLSEDALAADGLPVGLVPRLALDYGALLPVADPVQQVRKFAGRVMTRAARIEPVTPPGRIYATESFACEVALRPDSGIACDYAGRVPTAKDFGILPLYAVRRRRSRQAVDPNR